MRRVGVVAVLAVLATSLPGHAAATPDRVVRVPYARPAGVTTGSNDARTVSGPTTTQTAQRDEDRVTVTAADKGGTVALVVDVTRPHAVATRTVTCGRFTAAVVPGTTVAVSPAAGRCSDGRLAVPQGGTIALAFHKKPKPRAVTRGAPASMRWAVVIGIGDYAGSTHSTVGGVGDANAVRRALLKAGWQSSHILMVTDSRASASGIRSAMSWLAARSGPRTFSLLHFSGHVCIASRGPCASGHTYLWTYDNRFIPETEVRQRWAGVRGYGWLDVAGCEAGAFATSSPAKLFSGSSRASETSYENSSWHESYWAGLVWDRGYAQGLADDQGRAFHATIGEMTAYGVRQAPPMTARGEKGSQHPVVAGGSGAWTLSAPPGG